MKFNKSILVFGSSGQLCNQLFFFANLISFAKEHNYILINPSFYKYNHYFENISKDCWIRYPSKKSIIPNISCLQIILLFIFKLISYTGLIYTVKLRRINYLSTFLKNFGFNTTKENFSRLYLDPQNYSEEKFGKIKKSILASKLFLINGYLFKAENVHSHKEEIRTYFKIKDIYLNRSCQLIRSAREIGNILIGIHIRRRDYAQYRNGIYYYKDEVYINYALKVKSFFKQEVVFIICSDEKLNKSSFSELNCIISTNNSIIDLDILSNCNFIMGPPSTFSGWASFIKNIPLYHIKDKDSVNLKLEDFIIYNG